MFGSLLLFGLLPSANAQPVVVPEFRAAAAEDASVAFMLYNQLLAELQFGGFDVVDGERVWNRMRVNPTECATEPRCRRDMLEAFRGNLVLAGEAETDGAVIMVTIRYYSADRENPVEVFSEWIEPGDENRVLNEIVDLTRTMHRTTAPARSAEETRREEEARRAEDRRRREAEDRRREEDRRRADETRRQEHDLDRDEAYLDEILSLDEDPYADEAPPPSTSSRDSRSSPPPRAGKASEQAEMGIPAFLYDRYLSSGMRQQEWLKAKRVRQRALSVEAMGGLGRGDTDRSYDVRMALDMEDVPGVIGVYQYDTLLPGQWPQGMAGVGYNPTPWLELSLLGGIQYGKKFLTAGWDRFDCDAGGRPEDCEKATWDADAYEPVAAVSAVFEPRVRFYPLMTGFFKPFFVLGYNVRIMDDYQVPDLNTVDFPDSGRRFIHGLAVGGGAMIDVHPRVAILIDVPIVLELAGHEGRMETNPFQTTVPLPCGAEEPPCEWGYLLRLSAGLQVRI